MNLSGKNIVIVDDDLPSVRYLDIMLKSTGANTIVFNTGKAFVDYLGEEDKGIDIVFMDFLIPIINGIECVSEFRRERKNVPVIMITAYTSDLAKKDAFISGCNEYILKPIYPEKIFSILEKYLMPNGSVPSSY